MSRARFKIGDFELDVEGEESFVKSEIDRFQQMLATVPPKQTLEKEASNANVPPAEAAPRTRRGSKRSGPSCADRILGLKANGFFDTPKALIELSSKLKELATPYGSNHLGAALNSLIKRGDLRRYGEDGAFRYVNP
ncbi:MAG: hypothetical protein R3C30_06985 [Hyphomonadaceae bacterium]